ARQPEPFPAPCARRTIAALLQIEELQEYRSVALRTECSHCVEAPGGAETQRQVPTWSLILADQLNAISEGIVNVATADPGNIIDFIHLDAGAAQAFNQARIISTTQGRVSLLCRTKISLD